MYLRSFKNIVSVKELGKIKNDRFELGVYDCINSNGERTLKLVEYDFIRELDEVLADTKDMIKDYLNDKIEEINNSEFDDIMKVVANELKEQYMQLLKLV